MSGTLLLLLVLVGVAWLAWMYTEPRRGPEEPDQGQAWRTARRALGAAVERAKRRQR